MFDLTGKVIVLTGGAGILGTRISKALIGQGAKVAIADRAGDKAQSAASALGPFARGYGVDVTCRNSLEALREQVETAFGLVDVLVNNVAAKSPHFFEPFETFPLGDWNEVMNVNTTGVMQSCQVFGSSMAQRGKGAIITTLSVYGITGCDQRIYQGSIYEGRPINTPAVYAASKAALLGLTRYLATYWGHRGVRVNAITPGGVFSGQNAEFVNRYSARVPLGRMATPDEMSGAIAFLASDEASYVNGHNLVVDGGLTTW
jgi:NAD(P)-dependent dehydrogenase (short-subunit alcohol dehydrogenase family)